MRNGLLVVVLFISGCGVLPYGAYTNKFNEESYCDMAVASGRPDPSKQVSQVSFTLRKERKADKCGDRISDPEKQKNVLVLLALSGGGSRAAYFSALSMLEMQKMGLIIGESASDILHEVDAISSVSGGSLAAAYYATSSDPGSECARGSERVWDPRNDAEIRDLMTRRYRYRWIGNWFWPNNMPAFWFSKLDRTDIMAETLDDNLFITRDGSDVDLALGELNGLRPNLILNATSGTRGEGDGIGFGRVFTFTAEDFDRVCSSINDYSVARGVMATATFPSVFNFMTLKNHCWDHCQKGGPENDERYLHIFDGGNADNLGLTSIKRVIWKALNQRDGKPILPYEQVIVIQVDAFIDSRGAAPRKADPRGSIDFFLDKNFIYATDSLLKANRKNLLSEFETGYLFPFSPTRLGDRTEACTRFFHEADEKYCDNSHEYWSSLNRQISDKLTFVHLNFDRIEDVGGCKEKHGEPELSDCLWRQLRNIDTDFQLGKFFEDDYTDLTDKEAIECAVPLLFGRVDSKACGRLTPTPSAYLARKWENVRSILQKPDIGSPRSVDLVTQR